MWSSWSKILEVSAPKKSTSIGPPPHTCVDVLSIVKMSHYALCSRIGIVAHPKRLVSRINLLYHAHTKVKREHIVIS